MSDAELPDNKPDEGVPWWAYIVALLGGLLMMFQRERQEKEMKKRGNDERP